VKLVDLTRFLDPSDVERMPAALKGWSANLVPNVEPITPGGEGATIMCSIFGCEKHELPNGEGWGDERLRITTHLGTHVDAPLHYGSTCEGEPARARASASRRSSGRSGRTARPCRSTAP
jgi:hypothetical protein